MQFLLDHQIRDDNAWLMANPEAARGGFLMSDVKRYVRVDFVQHSCSAMLRAIPLSAGSRDIIRYREDLRRLQRSLSRRGGVLPARW